MSKKGFSLLEVVVAMVILSIVTVGGMSLMITTNKFILSSNQRYQAVCQAQAMLEKLRYYVSADTNINKVFNNGQHSAAEISLPQTPNISGVGSRAWDYEVVDVGGTNCKRVEVIVGWMEL